MRRNAGPRHAGTGQFRGLTATWVVMVSVAKRSLSNLACCGATQSRSEATLRVNRVVSEVRQRLPLFLQQLTFIRTAVRVAMGQLRTHAPQQTTSVFDHVGAASERILLAPEMERPPLAAVRSGVLIRRLRMQRHSPASCATKQTQRSKRGGEKGKGRRKAKLQSAAPETGWPLTNRNSS